ncbi:MAG TPA: GNAT family N-acetyltransferase [Burkholderiaceae bacterium]|nr:GNAT family N-acetyltransferase [Burkholderiaceae bacterium]
MSEPGSTAGAAWQDGSLDALLEAVLSTPRLRLEPQREGHAEGLFPLLADPRLYTHIPLEPPASLQALRERLARLSARRSPDGGELWLNWVMCDARDGAFVGRVQATVRAKRPAYLAYEVFPAHWHRGYALEGCTRVIRWLIDELDVAEFSAEVDALNAASLRLLDRLGFERVAFRAAADTFKGRVSDEWSWRLEAAAFQPTAVARGPLR